LKNESNAVKLSVEIHFIVVSIWTVSDWANSS